MCKLNGDHLLRLLLLISILALISCNLQNTMLYYPDNDIPSREALAAENIRFWPAGSENYRGFIGPLPKNGEKGTIVVFHGNAGTAADRSYYVQPLTAAGYRVILAEYPGYGMRKGNLGEESFVLDAKETLKLVVAQNGKPVFLLGESLGCGVAAAVAADSSAPIKGVILITPWDTLLSLAKEKFPWLPVRLFLTDAYDTMGNMKEYQGRIAVVAAERDEIIPIKHAETLYQSLSGNKKMWIIRGAGHNDWPDLIGPSLWKEIIEFVNE